MNPYGQGGYVIMVLCRTMEVTATIMDRIKEDHLHMEVHTIMATMILTTIPTINRTNQDRATTITDKEGMGITTTTTMEVKIAVPVLLEPAVPAACLKHVLDEVIYHQTMIKPQPISNLAPPFILADLPHNPSSQLPSALFILF